MSPAVAHLGKKWLIVLDAVVYPCAPPLGLLRNLHDIPHLDDMLKCFTDLDGLVI